jgi:hypothetical protein
MMSSKFYSITRLQELQAQQRIAPLSEALQAEMDELYAHFSAMRKTTAKHKFLPDTPRCIKCGQYKGEAHEATKPAVIDAMHQPRDLCKMLFDLPNILTAEDEESIVEQVKFWLMDCQHLARIEQRLEAQGVIQELIDRLK